MTEKRFTETISTGIITDNKTGIEYSCEMRIDDDFLNLVNTIAEENEHLKKDNNALIHLLENQSIIIQELHSKLLEYQIKEPIALTKEDLELMGKAIIYYTHGRCGE